jgi:hypothetical protein
METIEPRGRLTAPVGIEHPPEPARKIIAPPSSGTAQCLDLEALFDGDVLRLMRFARSFREGVEENAQDECHPWIRRTSKASGYGLVTAYPPRGGKKVLMAHRVAWALANQAVVPDGALVRRSCGTRSCCNAAHLWLGDYLGNRFDLRVTG